MKLKEIYEPLRPMIEKMDLVDVKIYPGMDGEVIEGTIEGFEGCRMVQLETESGWKEIDVSDIEDCIS